MGSTGGNKKGRKKSDRPSVTAAETSGPEGGGGGTRASHPERCRSFELSLKSSPIKLLPGMKLDLKKVSPTGLDVYYGNYKVLSIKPAQALQVRACMESGYRFPGEVVAKKDGLYGQFKRTT